MMSYPHTKFHENPMSSFRGVAMTSLLGRNDRQMDGQTDGRTDGRSDCTPRPAFAFGDAGNKLCLIGDMLQHPMSDIKTNVFFL